VAGHVRRGGYDDGMSNEATAARAGLPGVAGVRALAAAALALLVPMESLRAWLWLGNRDVLPAGVVWLAKLWVVALPIAWVALVDRRRPCLHWPRVRHVVTGGAWGLVMAGAIVASYLVAGRRWIDPAPLRSIVREVGLGTLPAYVLGALFWCLINALVEEYVWRWFVYGKSAELLGGAGLAAGRSKATAVGAAVLAAIFFALHHMIVLGVYFDWRVVVLGSTGVFAGGVLWSWLYVRSGSLWPAYVSHALADAAVFVLGYGMIFR